MLPLPNHIWIILLGSFTLGLAVLFIWMFQMPGTSHIGPISTLNEGEAEIYKRLRKHITILASDIGERNIGNYQKLQLAADYIQRYFQDLGYKVKQQEFMVAGHVAKNLEVEILGSRHPDEIVLVGAHYDSVTGSPGANDNASGVACLLEIPRLLSGQRFARTLRFVAFVNEEPPYFQSAYMGSYVYAKRCRQGNEKIKAMLSLETIGYYSAQKDSQHYPFPFGLIYPSSGNFLGFVGNMSSRNLLHECLAVFRRNTVFPSYGVAAPSWVTGVSWSDHASFWRFGYPAIMITDTALFRYPYYHTQEDTPDKINYDCLARVTTGIASVVVSLDN